MSTTSPDTQIFECAPEVFARRLANLLEATRRERGLSIRHIARDSNGRYRRKDLRRFEAGTMPLTEELVEDVTDCYQADLDSILPSRLPVVVGHGVLSAGGVRTSFTPADSTSLLTAYLRLIRQLRHQKKAPTVDLRRDDIEALAAHLLETGETVVERLAALMGATRTQRTAMATLFASGAIVIGLSTSATAMHGDADASTTPSAKVSSTVIHRVKPRHLEAPGANTVRVLDRSADGPTLLFRDSADSAASSDDDGAPAATLPGGDQAPDDAANDAVDDAAGDLSAPADEAVPSDDAAPADEAPAADDDALDELADVVQDVDDESSPDAASDDESSDESSDEATDTDSDAPSPAVDEAADDASDGSNADDETSDEAPDSADDTVSDEAPSTDDTPADETPDSADDTVSDEAPPPTTPPPTRRPTQPTTPSATKPPPPTTPPPTRRPTQPTTPSATKPPPPTTPPPTRRPTQPTTKHRATTFPARTKRPATRRR